MFSACIRGQLPYFVCWNHLRNKIRVPILAVVLTIAVLLGLSSAASANVITERILYRDGAEELEGYLAYDDKTQDPRPGVLVNHEWTGIGHHIEVQTRRLADLGYVAFAADIYGKDIRPQDPAEAAEWSAKFKKDRPLTRTRASAGLEVLQKHPLVDPERIAAIGYCFGGLVALELGRSGADLKGIVSFHGTLGTPSKEDGRNIKGKVLILHGGSDPYVPDEQVSAFENEMREAGVDWKLVAYGGAVHSFTNPDSGDDPSKGAAYNAKADLESWAEMRRFFDDIFAPDTVR